MANSLLQTDSYFFNNLTSDVFIDSSGFNQLSIDIVSKYATGHDLILKEKCIFDIIKSLWILMLHGEPSRKPVFSKQK